jgi:hypothetical protein
MEDAKENESKADEVDWRLAELIVNIQYACQRYYFAMMRGWGMCRQA